MSTVDIFITNLLNGKQKLIQIKESLSNDRLENLLVKLINEVQVTVNYIEKWEISMNSWNKDTVS